MLDCKTPYLDGVSPLVYSFQIEKELREKSRCLYIAELSHCHFQAKATFLQFWILQWEILPSVDLTNYPSARSLQALQG